MIDLRFSADVTSSFMEFAAISTTRPIYISGIMMITGPGLRFAAAHFTGVPSGSSEGSLIFFFLEYSMLLIMLSMAASISAALLLPRSAPARLRPPDAA